MFLGDLPDGASILIDANILAYHRIQIPGLTETVINFMERMERRQVVGYTSTALVAEAVHKVMLAEAVQQYGLPEKGIVTRLKEEPDLVKGLAHAYTREGGKHFLSLRSSLNEWAWEGRFSTSTSISHRRDGTDERLHRTRHRRTTQRGRTAFFGPWTTDE